MKDGKKLRISLNRIKTSVQSLTKKQRMLYVTSFLVVCVITFIFGIYSNFNKRIDNTMLENNVEKKGLSMMLETGRGTGQYEMAIRDKWPTEGYIFNETLSKCENGGTLEWDDVNKTVKVHTSVSDKCYVYFDVEPPDVYIATSNLPTTYGATGSVTCSSNGTTYNQKYNRVEISSINTKYENCSLTYTEPTSKTYMNDYIISLAGTTQGTGQVVNENGYRYEGKNPNNYIWFNNELWRIIGVFDEDSHGQSDTNLVKIMRADPIGLLAWDKSKKNDWTTASLNSLLNGAYLNAQDGTDSGYCYMYSNEVQANCDYRANGIQDGYRSMIQNVTWYLGGYEGAEGTAKSFYGYERGTTVYSGRPTTTTGYIGLMYPSDYGFSVLSSSCTRVITLSSYKSSSCGGQSWIAGNGDECVLSPDSSNSDRVFHLYSDASLYWTYAYQGRAVRPVLYLKADVFYVDGDGSIEDPIIIGE